MKAFEFINSFEVVNLILLFLLAENFPGFARTSFENSWQAGTCVFQKSFVKIRRQRTCYSYVLYKGIDGQFRLVRLQTDNFRLYNEQTVNGLRKNAWASVFRLKRQYIYIYIWLCIGISVYIYIIYI